MQAAALQFLQGKVCQLTMPEVNFRIDNLHVVFASLIRLGQVGNTVQALARYSFLTWSCEGVVDEINTVQFDRLVDVTVPVNMNMRL
jgi:hypothetical protein